MKKKIVSITIILSVTTFIILFLEFSLKFFFLKKNSHYSCYENVDDERIYKNGANCNFLISYFESKDDVIYYTDNFGNRVQTKNEIENAVNKIFFVGDSFTFGWLSNYDYTYPYSSVQTINKLSNKKYREVNKGVNGYQISQVLTNILKDKEIISSNDLIVYGLSPNDLFDLEDENLKLNSNYLDISNTKSNLLLSLTNKIKNSFALKYFASIVLKNDKVYNSIYLSRSQTGAGYIEVKINNSWKNKYKIVENLINELPNNIKNRMIILTIPQKIQINLINNNEIMKGISFDREIFKICVKLKIKCISLTKDIAKLKNTHYPLDGHMLPEANKKFGKLLGKKIFESDFLVGK